MLKGNSSQLKNLLFGTQNIPALIPGVILAVSVMLIALFITRTLGSLLPWEKNPLSPILVAILLGLIISLVNSQTLKNGNLYTNTT